MVVGLYLWKKKSTSFVAQMSCVQTKATTATCRRPPGGRAIMVNFLLRKESRWWKESTKLVNSKQCKRANARECYDGLGCASKYRPGPISTSPRRGETTTNSGAGGLLGGKICHHTCPVRPISWVRWKLGWGDFPCNPVHFLAKPLTVVARARYREWG